jgi:hypothetical protein
MQSPKIKEYSDFAREKISFWKTRFYNIGTEKERSSREFQFLFLSWFSLLIFFTFFILAEKNPFNLLVPFNVFQWPQIDHRKDVKVFISDGNENQIPVNRKVLVSENTDQFIYQLIGEIGSPPYFSVEESASLKDKLFNPKKLLDLQFSLKKIWIRDEGKSMILDWNESMLVTVMNEYRLPQVIAGEEVEEDPVLNAPVDTITYYSGGEINLKEGEEVTRERRLKALTATFKAIDATIFLNFPNVKSIEHRLDGSSKDMPGLDYKLIETKTQTPINP